VTQLARPVADSGSGEATENATLEKAAPNCRGGKCRKGEYGQTIN